MHGRADTMVPFAHSCEILYPLLRDPHPPLWLDACGHRDMPDAECLRCVAAFVGYVADRTKRVEARRISNDVWPLLSGLFS